MIRSMTPERAEIIGLQALAFIAEDTQAISGLLNNSGLGPQTLKQAAQEPAFLAGVLDFLLHNEDRLISFCDQYDLPPQTPARAYAALTGEPVAF